MNNIFCIHSSVERHLGSFQLLAIINNGAMNIMEHVSFLYVGTYFGYIPRSAISGSFQQNLVSVYNGVSVWKLIMGWIPGYYL